MPEKQRFDFNANIAAALANGQLRKNLRSAMDGLRQKRLAVFEDAQELAQLRRQGQAIKERALSRLPQLLEQLEEKCTANGIQVHWAETTKEANQTVLNIMQQHGATRLVKGKSMVSEEMHLNRYLSERGIEAIETDLGEFIIQLEGETPSHIIVPAVHKNKAEIARTFHKKIPGAPYTEKVEELNRIARQTLRQKFMEGEVGLSGVNFAVAETGTLCLVENEGNGRMCTTVPPVHIAVMGLEKVVEKLEEVPPLLRLLTGSATGQLITTYFNMITSPRKKGEKDGPRQVHLILLDNGRSRIFADPELRQTLYCIRCGTCLNHCPVYTRLGGHAYGFVYPGPIGKILTPQLEGLKAAGDLATASSLCNACEEVCPVRIPIPGLIRRIRNESYSAAASSAVPGHGYRRNLLETTAWKAWAFLNTHPALNQVNTAIAGQIGRLLPRLGPLKAWTQVHTRAQVHQVKRSTWTEALKGILRDRGLETLLYSPQSAIGPALEAAWRTSGSGLCALRAYDASIEDFKPALFNIDAAITTTTGAIAETGALVLWPDAIEPRLMSLVPPVHIAVLEADHIYNTFCEIIQKQNWPQRMPTNALLISGPSKTADIEMTLAFGVHGPRELIVLILSEP